MARECTAIGIDLGTTNSCVGVWKNGTVEIIENDQGPRLTPSMVAFTNIECLVGDGAKAQATKNPTNTVFGVKRLIGRKFNDTSLQEDTKMLPFSVISEEDRPQIEVTYKNEIKTFTPEQISAMILRKMKETAEARLEKEVTDAVITVPAYFNDAQRKATIDAGKIAGLNVMRILSEPTAAAIAYGMDKMIGEARNILVFDLGGGTFDVSIMTIKDGNFTVKAVKGDTHLGGDDFDRRLIEFLAKDFKRKYKKDILSNKTALAKLTQESEAVKRRLSVQQATSLHIDAILDGIDLKTNVTRNRLEEVNNELFTKTITTVEEALRDAKMEKSDIDDVLLVGGSTRIPKIQTMLKEFFDGKKLCHGMNPDEAVAYGAAVHAAQLQGDTSEAIQNVQLFDVIPLSLGIETEHGTATVLIPRNTTIPVKHTETFPTSEDNQIAVSVNIYEGEMEMFKDNHFLGKFILNGLPAKPKGVVTLDVTFDIDANGTLTVSAIETSSNVENQITITNDQGRLCPEDIAKMIKEAEKYKADDEQQRTRSISKTHLEDYIGNIELDVEETFMNKITAADKKIILDLCKTITNWLNADQLLDAREYDGKEEELKNIWTPIVRKLRE